jgi:RNA polymerase subunit RPABC4/transcription elongation factor Spt4
VSQTVDTDEEICRYCGFVIDHDGKLCPALDDGRCRP